MPTATDPTDALAERLFAATLGTLELFSIYLGAELGLLPDPRDARPVDSAGAGRAREHPAALCP